MEDPFFHVTTRNPWHPTQHVMASRGKVRSAELSSSDKTATKKAKGVSTASVSDHQLSPENQSELIKELSKGVLDTIRASIQEVIRETIDRELSKAVDKLTKVFEERLSKLESTCRQLEEKVQEPRPTAGESDLQQQVLCLQHALHQEEHAANFVLSGVPEATNQGEENHSKTVVVCCFIRETQQAYLGLITGIPRYFCNSCLKVCREEADLIGDGREFQRRVLVKSGEIVPGRRAALGMQSERVN